MLCLSAMTVSVVNYDNFSDCFEYRIITIIIITKGYADLLSAVVVVGDLRNRRRFRCGRPVLCSSGHAWIFFFIAPSRRSSVAAAAAVRRCAPTKAYDRASAWELHSRARNSLCIFNFLCLRSLPIVVDCNFPASSSGWKYCSEGYEFICERVRFLPWVGRLSIMFLESCDNWAKLRRCRRTFIDTQSTDFERTQRIP